MSRHAACPDARTLHEFALDKLGQPVAEGVRTHLTHCAECAATVQALKSNPASTDPATGASAATGNNLESGTELGETPTLTHCHSGETADSEELPFLLRASNPKAIGKVDNYEVLRVLGRGGMGIVLDAFDTVLHRRVAIKVLSPHLATSKKAQRRFLREARAAAGINHPNVVTIHAVDEKVPYLVMEYVAGRTLRERIRMSSSLDLISSLRIGAQIAAGLAAAHHHGVIHRDVKPANIMLEDGIERVKITDFGLALVALDASQVSSADRPVGTPAYMSPEQVSGGRVDVRSDLFSLGCVMYAMCCGKSPFQGNNALAIARQVADHMPPPLHEASPETPRFLSDIVSRLLAKNPDERFQTAKEVGDILLHHLAALNQGGSDVLETTVPLSLPRRSRRRWLTAAAVLLIGTVTATAFYLWGGKGPYAVFKVSKELLTVSQAATADFHTITEALAQAGPGTTIRIADAAVYQGPLVLNEPDRLRDVTIEAAEGASVENTESLEPVVLIENMPGVTLRGLRVNARDRQHGVSVKGLCDGLKLDGLHLSQPPQSPLGGLVLWDGTRGSAERPIVLRALEVRCGDIGVVLVGNPQRPAAWVRIENCRFTGPGVHVAMETAVRDVTLQGNIFTAGGAGVGIEAPRAKSLERLTITHNTFFQLTSWLALNNTSLEQSDLTITNNLIVQCDQIKLGLQNLAAVGPQWFRKNWWERSDGVSENQARLVADLKDEVKLLSRDPGSPDFLRPAPQPPPAGEAGNGTHAYIGALPPATASAPAPSHK